jgi:hypothetical protein
MLCFPAMCCSVLPRRRTCIDGDEQQQQRYLTVYCLVKTVRARFFYQPLSTTTKNAFTYDIHPCISAINTSTPALPTVETQTRIDVMITRGL